MINPVFVYISAWALVLGLYSLGLTSNLVKVSGIGLLVIVLNMLGITVISAFLSGGRRRKLDNDKDELYVSTVRSFLKFALAVWGMGTVFEIYVGNGFPLLWKFIGDPRLYTEFGVPSLHGVLNAFYLQALSMVAFLYFKLKQKRWVLLGIVLLCWPVAMLGRGILLSGLLQMTCIFLLVTRMSVKKLISLCFTGLLVIVIFGVLGDMRQTENPFSYLVAGSAAEFFESMPSGFLWFYVYLTAGLSNFFYNVDTVTPAWGLSYSLSNMLPSVVRSYLELDPRNDLFEFVDANLNTSTIYAGSVSDFGPMGGFVAVTIVQFVCCYVYSLTLKGKPWGIFAYTVAFQILIFSIFYDMFFLLPTLFQFAICMLLYLYYRYRVHTFASLERRRLRRAVSKTPVDTQA
jgi:oligosaccharide repeat unit polymerase